jgi:hypothetical protein
MLLEEFTVGRIANDAQLKIMKSHTIELHYAMELARAACPGRPRAKPEDILPRLDRKLWRGSSLRPPIRESAALRVPSAFRPLRGDHPRRPDDMGASAPPCLHGERTAARRQIPAGSGLRRSRGNIVSARGRAASDGGDRQELRR